MWARDLLGALAIPVENRWTASIAHAPGAEKNKK
jgi:hypothetical protein